MLTKEQKLYVEFKVAKYIEGMKRTHKADDSLIRAWGQRYRIAMERVLEKQGKR